MEITEQKSDNFLKTPEYIFFRVAPRDDFQRPKIKLKLCLSLGTLSATKSRSMLI